MKWAKACFLVLLVGTARAQVANGGQLRDVSGRWAEYYAAVYQVPVELVAAIIDEESGWNQEEIHSSVVRTVERVARES
jgi:soluble lytic murein transglycosylase-like protein